MAVSLTFNLTMKLSCGLTFFFTIFMMCCRGDNYVNYTSAVSTNRTGKFFLDEWFGLQSQTIDLIDDEEDEAIPNAVKTCNCGEYL